MLRLVRGADGCMRYNVCIVMCVPYEPVAAAPIYIYIYTYDVNEEEAGMIPGSRSCVWITVLQV